MFQVNRLVALVSLVLLFAGCSSNKVKTEQHKPYPLPKLEQPQSLNSVFSTEIEAPSEDDASHLETAVVDNRIYKVSRNGQIEAVEAKTRLWRVKPEQQISSGISIAYGNLLVGTRRGGLLLLSGDNGETLWRSQLSGSILSKPIVGQNRVVAVTNDNKVYGLDLASGQTVWTIALPEPTMSVRGQSTPVIMPDNRTVIVASSDASVVAIDMLTGMPRWQRRVAVSQGSSDVSRLIDIDGDPVIDQQKMYTVSYQGQATAIDLASQQVVWSVPASSLHTPVIAENQLYISSDDGMVKALDANTGATIWEQDQLSYRGLSNPARIGAFLVVGDRDGYIHMLNPANGEIVGRSRTKGAVRLLRVEDNQLYSDTSKGFFTIWQVKQ